METFNFNNPDNNSLPQGVEESDVLDAVSRSGYPLQGIVGQMLLSAGFGIVEEWAFSDDETGNLRALDILANKWLFDINEGQPRVRPNLSLLIECKQSTLPYVFFPSSGQTGLLDFPLIAGLPHSDLRITTDDSASTWNLPIVHGIGLDNHPFVTGPPHCFIFSKAVRKGKELQLSGVDPFQSLVLPLVKALKHFENINKPSNTALYFDGHATVGIGVLDAPMVAVAPQAADYRLEMVPWIRVLRHEYFERRLAWFDLRKFVLDLVHKDFLPEYLSTHLGPFADDYSRLVLKHQNEIRHGKAYATEMNAQGHNGIEARLRPRPMTAGWRRRRIVLQNVWRLIRGRDLID